MSEEVIHELVKPFSYTPKNSGEPVDAQFITLLELSVRNLTACATLKQAFMRVLAAANSDEDAVELDEDKPDDVPMENRVINALYTSDAVDMNVVLLSAKELFREVALVDGEKKITAPMLDAMSMDDIEQMTGKYMVNFILASVLKGQ